MDVSKMSDIDQRAVCKAMEYWVEHWDRECPTLFGIELNELTRVLHRWPLIYDEDKPNLELAAVGALRELIYGASSLSRAVVQETIGVSYDQAETLLETLSDE